MTGDQRTRLHSRASPTASEMESLAIVGPSPIWSDIQNVSSDNKVLLRLFDRRFYACHCQAVLNQSFHLRCSACLTIYLSDPSFYQYLRLLNINVDNLGVILGFSSVFCQLQDPVIFCSNLCPYSGRRC
ncbi:hypothetical protein AB1N83_002203 [Pleurotus pulmonarius]